MPLSFQAAREKRRINAPPIIADTQPELLALISNMDFDLPGMGMSKGIAQTFDRNFVNLIADDGMQVARLTLYTTRI